MEGSHLDTSENKTICWKQHHDDDICSKLQAKAASVWELMETAALSISISNCSSILFSFSSFLPGSTRMVTGTINLFLDFTHYCKRRDNIIAASPREKILQPFSSESSLCATRGTAAWPLVTSAFPTHTVDSVQIVKSYLTINTLCSGRDCK